jgi:hypothetical protein
MCVACLLCSYKNRPPSERRLLVLLVAAILLRIALIIALAVLSFHCKCTPRSKHTYLIACEMSRTRTDSHSFSQTIKYFLWQNKAIHFQTFQSVLTFSVRHLNAIKSTAGRSFLGIKPLPAFSKCNFRPVKVNVSQHFGTYVHILY